MSANENEVKTPMKDLFESFNSAKPKDYYGVYQNEITKYLASKLVEYNVPIHTIMEIAQYAMYATALVSNNELRENCRMCRNRNERGIKRASRGAVNGSNTDKQND